MSDVRLVCLIFSTNCPWSAPMHVGERPTWLNTGDFSFEKYPFNKNAFFQKFFFFRKSFFQKFFFSVNKVLSPKQGCPYYQVHTKGVYVGLNRPIFFFSKKRSLSRDKATELSQVERSPTCIGADTGRGDDRSQDHSEERSIQTLIRALSFTHKSPLWLHVSIR